MSHVAVLSRSRSHKRFRSYFLQSPVGNFAIMRDPSSPWQWNLFIGAKKLGRYDSAEDAIRAVEDRRTGLPNWDEAGSGTSNLGLFEWKTL
jgi:hypothetical protein